MKICIRLWGASGLWPWGNIHLKNTWRAWCPFWTDGCLVIKESLGSSYLKQGSQHLCYCSLSDLLGQFKSRFTDSPSSSARQNHGTHLSGKRAPEAKPARLSNSQLTRYKLQHLETLSLAAWAWRQQTEPLPSQITAVLDVHQASTVPARSCLAQHVPVMDCCTCKFSHLVGDILTISFLTRNKSIYGYLLFINNLALATVHTHVYLASSVIYYPFFFLFLPLQKWHRELQSLL